jgi:hypothetical protein
VISAVQFMAKRGYEMERNQPKNDFQKEKNTARRS